MKKPIKTLLELILLGVLVTGLVFAIVYLRTMNIVPGSQPYPPPSQTAINTPTVLPYPPPGENSYLPTPTLKLIGPTCFTDQLNHFSIQLASGWRASMPPDVNAVGGASVFYNYNPEEVTSDHGAVELPVYAVKIQITSAELGVGQSFEQWVNESVNATEASDISKQYTTTATIPYPYNIANYDGMAYTVSDQSGTNTLVIDLSIDDSIVLIIAISPADSPALSEALLMLTTLNAQVINPCPSGTSAPDRQVISTPEIKKKSSNSLL